MTTYTAGQSFSELPSDRHNVSANASQTKLAKFPAVFVVDTNNTRVRVFVKSDFPTLPKTMFEVAG